MKKAMCIALAAIMLLSVFAFSATVATAATPTAAGAPQPISTNGANLNLFVLGSDKNIWTKSSADGATAWTAATSIGSPVGGATSDPSVIKSGANMMVFIRGSDGALYSKTSAGASWAAATWVRYPTGVLKVGTGPSAVSDTTIFVTGANSKLYVGTINGAKDDFSWISLDGILSSSPAAVSTTTGTTVFVAGSTGTLYSISQTGTTWAGWFYIGGTLRGGTNPAAYSWTNGRVGLLVTGESGKLYEQWWQGTTANGWTNLGGYLTSSPGATAKTNGVADVFVLGRTSDFTGTIPVYQKSLGGTGWDVWKWLGGL